MVVLIWRQGEVVGGGIPSARSTPRASERWRDQGEPFRDGFSANCSTNPLLSRRIRWCRPGGGWCGLPLLISKAARFAHTCSFFAPSHYLAALGPDRSLQCLGQAVCEGLAPGASAMRTALIGEALDIRRHDPPILVRVVCSAPALGADKAKKRIRVAGEGSIRPQWRPAVAAGSRLLFPIRRIQALWLTERRCTPDARGARRTPAERQIVLVGAASAPECTLSIPRALGCMFRHSVRLLNELSRRAGAKHARANRGALSMRAPISEAPRARRSAFFCRGSS
jgi:hypothetical protein